MGRYINDVQNFYPFQPLSSFMSKHFLKIWLKSLKLSEFPNLFISLICTSFMGNPYQIFFPKEIGGTGWLLNNDHS